VRCCGDRQRTVGRQASDGDDWHAADQKVRIVSVDRSPDAVTVRDLPWKGAQRRGEGELVAVLAARSAANVSLDNPLHVAHLLDRLREVGTGEQVALLATRAAAQTPLDDQHGVDRLLADLQLAGANTSIAKVIRRLPGAGNFELFATFGENGKIFAFGREHDGSIVPPWTWSDLTGF
jgi:hypothetical protein